MARKPMFDKSALASLSMKRGAKEEQQTLPEIEPVTVAPVGNFTDEEAKMIERGGNVIATREAWDQKQRRITLRIPYENNELIDRLEDYARERRGLNKTIIQAIEEFLERNT